MWNIFVCGCAKPTFLSQQHQPNFCQLIMFDGYDDDNGSDKGHSRKDSDQYSGWVSPRSPTPLEDYEIRAHAHNQTPTSTTSGYPRSDPIRLNNFSLALSLIGFFQYGLPGQIFFFPGLSQDKTYRVANVPIVGLF